MTPSRTLALLLAAAAVVLTLLWRGAVRREALADAAIRARDGVIAAGWDSAAAWDRRLRVDTLRLTTAVTRYRTLRDTLLLHATDTVTVERFVAVADSTVEACSVALADCKRRGDAWQAVADSERVQLAALTKARRGCRVLGLLPCPRPGVAVGLGDDGKPHTVVGVTLGF